MRLSEESPSPPAERQLEMQQEPSSRRGFRTAPLPSSYTGLIRTSQSPTVMVSKPGPGVNQRGSSLDPLGNEVPHDSPAAHWPVNH